MSLSEVQAREIFAGMQACNHATMLVQAKQLQALLAHA